MAPTSTRISILAAILAVILLAADAKTYVALSSGTCESAGFQGIYSLEECAKGAKETGLDIDVRVSSSGRSQNIPNGCTVPEDDTNGYFRVVSQPADVCIPGTPNKFYSRASKEISFRTCGCNRFDPCVCIKN